MEMDITQYLMTQGPFAVLFCYLLYYVMKTSKEREAKLYGQIDSQNELLARFSDKYEIVIDKLDEIQMKIEK
ncbi:BhlA/UviB family holin-like peptide [Bacillus atrophaeus]|uniref:BhlA/UviB family holin-like peptide n=1 Tax=Bacillus atrophaeus TaxID=1452 RepID=UPI00228325AC|nr:BhlA/UviB family holin-like peptide [Bacillus atrophaeus]MCY8842477.1 BhlA/UviB family holin-like peptide [Bacillus atrophaeus]MCY8916295.1 BhlA/UviB family holin-like peptide [Bacillus atrophaeus]MCY8926452.1 BhlA/UviB family holin-like peptide [Bacillus atrophaeus]MEC0804687.1 BhlA/UviB family holin-like peptide [Bacillus atrophaeus]MEC0852604.1 BhlA/UviB family holin-like peptide [Bacillus atrophaeus]